MFIMSIELRPEPDVMPSETTTIHVSVPVILMSSSRFVFISVLQVPSHTLTAPKQLKDHWSIVPPCPRAINSSSNILSSKRRCIWDRWDRCSSRARSHSLDPDHLWAFIEILTGLLLRLEILHSQSVTRLELLHSRCL